MINAEQFIEAARKLGFQTYTGVPCSFLTPFINYVINDESLSYISSANEGDALATAAGATIGGERSVVMMQNSGLGNAVSPLSSLLHIFRIPVLIITTHRGAPGIKDEPQHELMGEITGDLFDTMQVPWEIFPTEESAIMPVLQRATRHMQSEHRPYALIMKKGSVAPYDLERDPVKSIDKSGLQSETFLNVDRKPVSRNEALQRIIRNTQESETIIIATTGFTGRELYAIDDRNNHLYMVGSMGCASALGLGLSLARPDLEVVVVDGDGAALMRMGNFATIGSYAADNLVHILLDNGVHDSTGAQATVSRNVNFADIATACGYGLALSGNEAEMIDKIFTPKTTRGPRFVHLHTRPGSIDNLPRPDITPTQVLERLMHHIGTRF